VNCSICLSVGIPFSQSFMISYFLAPIVAASCCGGVRHKRYSV
jgi:hypothetical protein